ALHGLVRVRHEELEQVELGPGQLDHVAAPPDLARRRVELDVGEPEHAVQRRRPATDQRPHPGEQLLQRERLDEVVVRAGVEAFDAVADGVAGGQHQDGHRVPASTDPATHLAPVDAGHQDVEYGGAV